MLFLYILTGIVLGVFLVLLLLPNKYLVKRSRVMNLPLEKAFEYVVDFDKWHSWSPWLIYEPDCPTEISKPSDKEGSYQQWDGHYIGSGKTTHLKIEKNKRIEQLIEFIRPFKSKSNITWVFKKLDEGVEVTWQMQGSSPFFFKFLNLMMERMVGPDFEVGLEMLEMRVDKTKPSYHIDFVGEVNWEETYYFYEKIDVDYQDKVILLEEIKKSASRMFALAKKYKVLEKEIVFLKYQRHNFKKNQADFEVCVPFKGGKVSNLPDNIKFSHMPKKRFFLTKVKADYRMINRGYYFEKNNIRLRKLRGHGFLIESYEHLFEGNKGQQLVTNLYRYLS